MTEKIQANDKLQMTNDKEQGVENNKKKKVKKPRRVERVRWKDIFNFDL